MVAIIVVITAFVSITHFKILDQFHADYVNDKGRQNYYYQLRSVYVNSCEIFQPPQVCDMLAKFKNNDMVRNPYLANADAKRYLTSIAKLNGDIYSNWHSESFMRKRFTKHGRVQELNELVVLSMNNKSSLNEMHRNYGLLSRANFGIITTIKAQITHSDWFHLIGNLIFFLFFGACVEQAMGRRWLLGIYFVGGTLGLITQLALAGSSTVFVLGASANIFACAGAFLRLYWKQPLELFFSFFFVANRTIRLPTWSFFVFFVLIQQISGLTTGDETGIAYLAHLVGLGYGFGIAHYWSIENHFVPTNYMIFPYEKEMLARVTNSGPCKERYNLLIDLIFYAPNNLEAYEKFYSINKACTCETRCLSQGSRKFIGRQMATPLKQLLLDKEVAKAAQLFSKSVELECPGAEVLTYATASDVMTLANLFYKEKSYDLIDALFSAAILTFTADQRMAFEQFLDSLKREREGKHAS